ncbi:hypothetical protein RvY_01457 [Ramazzottius varieornatus]|uniref:Uncharacterized protein n=1 Tax=Ramazzottius varieornatus TaxID=947166 RepID=A0A1D1UMG5_RAMVA|nr:hypothetical protein RvY_01457 [Ramazzottius varieornatus]
MSRYTSAIFGDVSGQPRAAPGHNYDQNTSSTEARSYEKMNKQMKPSVTSNCSIRMEYTYRI